MSSEKDCKGANKDEDTDESEHTVTWEESIPDRVNSKFKGPEAGAKVSIILLPPSCVSNLLVISQMCRYTLGVYVNMYNIHNIDIIYVRK